MIANNCLCLQDGRKPGGDGSNARLQEDEEAEGEARRYLSQGAVLAEGDRERCPIRHQGMSVSVPKSQVELHDRQEIPQEDLAAR